MKATYQTRISGNENALSAYAELFGVRSAVCSQTYALDTPQRP